MHLTHTLHASADFIFDHLTDMQKFRSVHPIITKIVHLDDGQYRAYEKLPLPMFSMNITYPFRLSYDRVHHTVHMKAVVMRFIDIVIDVKINQLPDHTLIDELIDIRAPWPLPYFIKGVFRRQHDQLFANIGGLLP